MKKTVDMEFIRKMIADKRQKEEQKDLEQETPHQKRIREALARARAKAKQPTPQPEDVPNYPDVPVEGEPSSLLQTVENLQNRITKLEQENRELRRENQNLKKHLQDHFYRRIPKNF